LKVSFDLQLLKEPDLILLITGVDWVKEAVSLCLLACCVITKSYLCPRCLVFGNSLIVLWWIWSATTKN